MRDETPDELLLEEPNVDLRMLLLVIDAATAAAVDEDEQGAFDASSRGSGDAFGNIPKGGGWQEEEKMNSGGERQREYENIKANSSLGELKFFYEPISKSLV